ncbi:hypothetical protein DINM_000899 [Dirofilaria immitis]|nr:hypothetical protein [Dirofilaria immitis]
MSEKTETVVNDKKKVIKETKEGKSERESSKFVDTNDYLNRSPDDPRWFDRKYNRKQMGPDGPLWTAPLDARYQQIKMGRHCTDYYQDYYRCINLLGEDYKPCKFFTILLPIFAHHLG